MTQTTERYACPWCKHVGDATTTNCPACGAPVDVRQTVTDSGWTELPAIRDMAKIQFGQSTCQIEGKYVPIADFNLAPGDGIYFSHHLLLWKDDQAQLTTMKISGWFKRLIAGLPLVMTQAHGPGRIAFSKDRAGELIALPLQPNQGVIVREKVFMIATHSVAYDWKSCGIWFRTAEDKSTETHYPLGRFLDHFSTGSAPGLLLLHGGGNVFVRQLAPGQTILVKPTSFLFCDPSVTHHLHFEHPGGTWKSWRSWGDRYLWLRLTGPGRVAVQSHYEPLEDPGRNLYNSCPATTRKQW